MLLVYVLECVMCNWSDRIVYSGFVVSILLKKCVFCLILVDFDGCGVARCCSTFGDSLKSFCTMLDMYHRHLSALVSMVWVL
jgi:hypothetical protein